MPARFYLSLGLVKSRLVPEGMFGRTLCLSLALFVLASGSRIFTSFLYVAEYDRYEDQEQLSDDTEGKVHAMVKGDAGKYYMRATTIIEQIRGGENWFVAGDAYFGPVLYERLIAIYGLVTGHIRLNQDGSVATGQILGFLVAQSLFSGVAVAVFFLALTKIISTRIAGFSAGFLSLEPTLVQFAARTLTETVFIGILMLAVASFIFAVRPRPESQAVKPLALFMLLGLLTGMMFLQRPGSLPIVVIFLVALLAHFSWKGLRPFMVASAMVVAPLVVTLLLVGLHNHLRAGYFGITNPQSSYTLYEYMGSRIVSESTGAGIEETRRALRAEAFKKAQSEGVIDPNVRNVDELTEAERSRFWQHFYRDRAIGIILDHPVTTLRLIILKGLASTHINPLGTYRRYDMIYNPADRELYDAQMALHDRDWPLKIAYSMLVLPLALAGWLFARKSLPLSVHVLFTLAIAFSPLMSGLAGSASARYTLPNMVFYSVYWTFGIALLVKVWPSMGILAPKIRQFWRHSSAVSLY